MNMVIIIFLVIGIINCYIFLFKMDGSGTCFSKARETFQAHKTILVHQ